MISNIEIDAGWFFMLHADGFTIDEIAGKPCVWMTADEIAAIIGVEYNPVNEHDNLKSIAVQI